MPHPTDVTGCDEGKKNYDEIPLQKKKKEKEEDINPT